MQCHIINPLLYQDSNHCHLHQELQPNNLMFQLCTNNLQHTPTTW